MTPSQKDLLDKIEALEKELTNPDAVTSLDEEAYRKKKSVMELLTRQFCDATGKSILITNLQENKQEPNPLQFCKACPQSTWMN